LANKLLIINEKIVIKEIGTETATNWHTIKSWILANYKSNRRQHQKCPSS